MTKPVYDGWQLTSLVILRWLIGWHLLYEGIAKLLNPYWTSAGFLAGSPGPLAEQYLWLASDPGRLSVVDFLNEWGLVLLGLGLVLGAFTRTSTVLAMVLLALYYLGNPPWLGIESTIPAEGSYLIVNKTLIELAALGVLLAFPTGRLVGLDAFWGNGEAR
jgi:thiosulfate dehydrogenase [quinone] large subunit